MRSTPPPARLHRLPRAWAPLACLALLCTAVACDNDQNLPPALRNPRSPAASATPVIPVVATVYPLADLIRSVGGRHVEVVWLVETGQSIEGYEPSREQLERFFKAAIVASGGTGEEFVTRYFTDGGFNDRRLIRLDAFAPPESRGARQQWLDPRVARATLAAAAQKLTVIRPEARAEFEANAAAAIRVIDSLIDDHETRLSGLSGRTVAAIGRDYAPLGRFAGCNVVKVSDRSAVQLDPERARAVGKAVIDAGAILLLVEADTPPAVLRALQAQMPVPVVAIDSLGSSSSVGRNTYDALMRYNFQQLYDGWRRAMSR